MKKIYVFCLLFFCITTISAQKMSVLLNGNYRTKINDWGIGTQVMVPVYKNWHLAPNVNYFFNGDHRFKGTITKGMDKIKTLNFGIDMHYTFYSENSQFLVSPLVGIEGMLLWSKLLWDKLLDEEAGRIENSWGNEIYFNANLDEFHILGNIGVAGKWFVTESFFFNTQVKYSFILNNFDFDNNYFVFTAGVGYAF